MSRLVQVIHTGFIMNILRHLLVLFTITAVINSFVITPQEGHRIQKRSTSFSNISYALLMAGSCGMGNYRHQADVAHAYHILISKGVPASKIVVIMCDDVANSKQNPDRGTLKSNIYGQDYYAGLKVDYRFGDVGIDTFKAALTGNWNAVKKIGTSRVLESTTNDNIFLYMSGHAEPGIFYMPFGPNLSRKILQDTIKRATFRTMSVYIESCESASLLEGMENDARVFGITASNAKEVSLATNCYDNFCYADEFSLAWMKDSESFDIRNRQLIEQYNSVKSSVRGSHVTRFGSSSLEQNHVSEYQGFKVAAGNILQLENDGGIPQLQKMAQLTSKEATANYYKIRALQATIEEERLDAKRILEKLNDIEMLNTGFQELS